MPKTTHVQRAQQRYATVPVIDPETGQQKRTPVMRNGVQKTTKTGRLVFLPITARDLSQPLPMPECDAPACKHETRTIEVGTAYKWIAPKTSTYGSRTMYRHEDCPPWQVWEYSDSLSAQIAHIEFDYEEAVDAAESEDDVTSALEAMADAVQEIADAKAEAGDNVEEGFGQATGTSDELHEQAESLETWADEIRGAEVPELTDHTCETCDGEQEIDCETCGGEGEHEIEVGAGLSKCEDCNGTGKVDCDNDDCQDGCDTAAWREAVQDIDKGECPV